MYPDYRHALIDGRPATEVIGDAEWFESAFTPHVQNRGAAIIKARGQSSAASAANAVVDSVRAVHHGTDDDWMSLAVVSRGQYGVPEGMVFSYPVQSDGRTLDVVGGIEHGAQARAALRATADELSAECERVRDLAPD